jgi:catechol 2,3-dioxygenase-like lactoylglutathione lyase family enzyme
MFDHVTIRVSDRNASERFYETVLGTLGIAKTHTDEHLAEWNDFSLAEATDDEPVTKRLHIAFVARSRALADEFWRVGTVAGYRDNGAPGLRPQYGPDYYGAFLLDPDGNSAEAVHHDGVASRRGGIDHLWIRVADLAAAKSFYEVVAPYGGFRRVAEADSPARVQFGSESGSFSVVAETPTEHVHIAFPATDNARVDDFHHAAIEAGYRSHGAPGERPIYHEGYYGAYVLDPDGNNVEVVNHNRG